MKKKIIIIGKNSFIGSNINLHLRNKFKVININLNQFKKFKKNQLKKFDYICNCSVNKKYQTYEGVISFINMFKKEIEIMYLRNILIIKKISE